ncbi:hypothetical protein D9758_008458 [Tetrapyrgos nigripes]|uniref:Ubiquitin-like domain-containing protein n=1 Tax=Tetrapyrgos nigripes TaxID=182062 RepID=A0A8H5CQQ3_9AGAR|nr:hypothetical protein D9758_008458 [Tetrapyrgos nigripes]
MSVLSEKAKGKQRVVDIPLGEPSGSAAPNSRNLTIRFSEDLPDLDVIVKEKDTVRDVKRAIRLERPKLKDRRLRLIHSGKLLTDGILVFPWLKSLDERQKRAIAESNTGDTSTPSVAAWLHCSVGGKLEDNEEEAEEEKTQTMQIRPPRGFDRFASLGFTEAEIASIRRQFHSQSSVDFLDDDNLDQDEDHDEHFRALEEQWIDSMDSSENVYLSQSSSNSTAIQGILTGFFFPFIPFFVQGSKPPQPIFWEDGRDHPEGESVVFSRTMQFGVVAGFLINIVLGLWRFLLDSS